MGTFPILNQHVSHGVRTALLESNLEERFTGFLGDHKQGDAGELGAAQTVLNRTIMRRWRTLGRKNVADTVRSEFRLEPGVTLVILTCRHFTTVFAKDEYYAWTPEELMAEMA